jgi:hypothetical protein
MGRRRHDTSVLGAREGLYRRFYVMCTNCGPSPQPWPNEIGAVRGRWWHELDYGWPQWLRVEGERMRRLMLRSGLSWRRLVGILIVWTIFVAFGFLILRFLNVGVTEADIRECVQDEIIPPGACEETLQAAEEGEFRIGVPALVMIWFGGAFPLSLVWLLIRHRSADGVPTG